MHKMLLLLVLLFAGAAQGADRRIYLGATLGGVENQTDSVDNFQLEDTTVLALRLLGGIDIRQNIAIEAALTSLGSYESKNGVYEESYSALTVSIVPSLPLEAGSSVFGQLGFGRITWQRTLDLGGLEIDSDDSGDVLTAGIGLMYTLRERLRLRAGINAFYFETSNPLTNSENQSQTLNQLGVGAVYHIR